MMRAGPRGSIAVGVLLGLLAACAPPPRGDTIVLASGADLEGMNPLATVHPLSRQLQRFALFVTLTRLDSALAPQPYFARAWAWSADRATLTLRTFGALAWHDGERVTARDAAFTLEAARDPRTGYPRASALAALDTAWAANDTTLVLRFRAAQPELPAILSELPLAPTHLLSALPRSELRRAPFARAPVGCGPFRFESQRPGIRWRFTRNAAFPAELGGPAHAAALAVVVIDEPSTKLAGLVSGELDVAGIAPTMARQAANDPSLRVVSYPVLFTHTLVFNTTRPPLNDARVRRALALAVNRTRIVDVALAGYGAAASGPMPAGHPLAPLALPTDTTMSVDALLDAAGWTRRRDGSRAKDDRPLELSLRFVASGDNLVEQLVQADLAAHGVVVSLRAMEFGAFLAEARRPDRRFDLLLTGVPGDLALSQVRSMFDSREAGGPLDYAGFHSAALDRHFAQLRSASSPSKLAAAWRDVLAQLRDDAPVAWLVHARGVQGVARRLHGVTMDLRGELPTVASWQLGPR